MPGSMKLIKAFIISSMDSFDCNYELENFASEMSCWFDTSKVASILVCKLKQIVAHSTNTVMIKEAWKNEP